MASPPQCGCQQSKFISGGRSHKSMQILEGGALFWAAAADVIKIVAQFGARPLLSPSGRFAAALISGAAISHRQLITINFVSLSSRAIKAMVKQYNCPDGGPLTACAVGPTTDCVLCFCLCCDIDVAAATAASAAK
jgi:hypothetical protein